MSPPLNDSPSISKYGSVNQPEHPTPHSNLRSIWSKLRIDNIPTTTGVQSPPLQQNTVNLQHPEFIWNRRSRRLAVGVLFGLSFLAGVCMSWSRSVMDIPREAAAVGLSEIGPDTDVTTDAGGAFSDAAAFGKQRIHDPSSFHLRTPSTAAGAAVSALEFTALNFYNVRDGKPGQDYPWLQDVKLIEPHRDTTLAVVGAREGFDYRWEVRSGSAIASSGGLGEIQATATGAVTIVVLTQLNDHVVVLEEFDGDGLVTNRLEERVLVKYVRREIRTLMDEEREELLDAMLQLWSVRVHDGDGKERYGEDYADVYAISRMHYLATTNATCDHFHAGLGFLVTHSLITNTFEFSLQLVNPKLTMPYWDFTIETTQASKVEYDPSQPHTRSELLSASYFGSADIEDNMVKDGRWAYTPVPQGRDDNPGKIETDIYGNLRSPWNTNNRAYLARGLGEWCSGSADGYVDWPSCGTHFNLTTTNGDFYSWVWDSMGDSHGPVHLWLGGVTDCASTYNRVAHLVGSDIAASLAFLAVGHRRELFCEGYWTCAVELVPVDVMPSELLSSGTCGCLDYDLTQGDDYKQVMSGFDYLEFYIGGFSGDIQRQVVEALCSGVVNLGDLDQSSASMDPLFWPIHPTMERLWQFAVLTGQVKQFDWPDVDVKVTLADGTDVVESISDADDACYGHRGSDVFPYGLLDADIDGFDIKTGIRDNPVTGNILSNREVLEALSQKSDSLTYVYDTFKWDHCVSEGFDFDDAWADTPPSARKAFFQIEGKLPTVYTSFQRKMAERMKGQGGQPR